MVSSPRASGRHQIERIPAGKLGGEKPRHLKRKLHSLQRALGEVVPIDGQPPS